ncbi:NAD(P)-binding protein [Linderina pennispora]|uniref:NAD(P)-binding protein n=1 Tax=Linderina pennispora TaxID=61395 RepID=A0A1Y1WJ52_9FUNG|nr:NAD(P)-binding protein [Linderina pennispora]ORX73567.1 NAD(P)-binding protein [Linderina pennispora]
MDIATLFGVKGKTIVITGRGLVANGANVYITSRQEKYLKDESERLTAEGPGTCSYVVCDLVDYEQVQALATKMAELAPGGIDVLTMPDQGFGNDLLLNLQRPFTVTQALLPLLKKTASAENPARVINVASISGNHVLLGTTYSYNASKAGLIHLTSDMAYKLAADHINVNSISPGMFPSRMLREPPADANPLPNKVQDYWKNNTLTIQEMVPLGRTGSEQDIAGAIIYLGVSGQRIRVVGGLDGAQLANGPSAIDNTLLNNGAFQRGFATGGDGPTAVGNGNFVLPRQVVGGNGDAQLANGPSAINSQTVNKGAMDEGVVKDTTSFDGAAIINPVGNTMESDTTNVVLHDNNIVNPEINVATGDHHGPTIVGDRNTVEDINSGPGFGGIVFDVPVFDGLLWKRQQGVLTEGSTDSENTEIAGNEFVDPTFNSVSGNNGPALAGDNNIFIPINNEGMIVNLDGSFAAQQAANQQAIIDRFTHHGLF